jgi:hypothetical protein
MLHSQTVHSPFRATRSNAVTEPLVRSVHEKCLDQTLDLNENHFRRILKVYGEYPDHDRPD